MDSLHIALATGATMATVCAAYACERWTAWKRTANRQSALMLECEAECDRAEDNMWRLSDLLNEKDREAFLLAERLAAVEGLVSRQREDIAFVKAAGADWQRIATHRRDELAALKAKASERTRRGNLTRYAKRRAEDQHKRLTALAALEDCAAKRKAVA